MRNALGIQQTPPNLVLYGIALALTAFISAPVAEGVVAAVMSSPVDFARFEDWTAALSRAREPVQTFLMRFSEETERAFFLDAARQVWPEDTAMDAETTDLVTLVPAFMVTELRRAFEIGVLIYLPFVTIDLIVTTVLMAMGMSMVTPTIISTPCKLLLFVAIDGWSALLQGLLLSYAM